MTLPSSGDAGFSIVVASTSGEAALHDCLESLEGERQGGDLVVAGAIDRDARQRLALRFPEVVWCDAPKGSSVFRLRALGLEAARGGIVALVEDHVRVHPGWTASLEAALGRGGFAGGPVECGKAHSLRSFALYLVEYSALMPPLADGPCPGLLAVNAAYRRHALGEVAPTWHAGFYDNEVHDALAARGHLPRVAAAALASSTLDLSWRAAIGHLFAGGRRFGAYRRTRASRPARLLRLLSVPLVPLVLLVRILGRVRHRRPSWLGRTLLALPHLVVLLVAWGGGELLGALPASKSVSRA